MQYTPSFFTLYLNIGLHVFWIYEVCFGYKSFLDNFHAESFIRWYQKKSFFCIWQIYIYEMQRLITFQIISQWRLKCFDNHIFNHFFLNGFLIVHSILSFKNQHTVLYLLLKLFLISLDVIRYNEKGNSHYIKHTLNVDKS